MVVALVIVVHLGVRGDPGGDFIETFRRHGDGGQRADADTPGCEHRADAADCAALLQVIQRSQHILLRAFEPASDVGERFGHQRKTTLEIVEQPELGGGIRRVHLRILYGGHEM